MRARGGPESGCWGQLDLEAQADAERVASQPDSLTNHQAFGISNKTIRPPLRQLDSKESATCEDGDRLRASVIGHCELERWLERARRHAVPHRINDFEVANRVERLPIRIDDVCGRGGEAHRRSIDERTDCQPASSAPRRHRRPGKQFMNKKSAAPPPKRQGGADGSLGVRRRWREESSAGRRRSRWRDR